MKTATTWLFLASATIAQAATAQPAPPPAPPPAPRVVPPRPVVPARPAAAAPGTTPTAPTPGAAGSGAATGEPNLPDIADPMLVPPAAAARELQSWQEALALLRSQSPALKTALARVDQAAARSRQTLAAALPTLLGTAQVGTHLLRGEGVDQFGVTQSLPDPPAGYYGQLDLRVPIFALKAWYDRGTAEHAIDTTRLEVSEVQRQIIAAVADAIVNAVTGERLAEVTRVSLKSALSLLDLNKRRAALGASSTLDVLRAEQEVERARLELVTADEALLRTREALGLALGSSEPWGVTTGIHLDSLAQDARRHCRQVGDVQKRPDILAANSNLSLVERQKGSVDRAFWPTIDAGSTLRYEGADQINGQRLSWTIGALLSWTLYDGGLRYGQKDEAAANLKVAREQLNETRLNAELEVNRSFRAVKVADASLTVSSRQREISAETARLARIAYLNGSGTSFDLVDNARLLREAEIDLAVKEFAALRARVAALLALADCDL